MTRANRAHLAAFGLLAALSACTSGNLEHGAGGGNAATEEPPAEGVRSSPVRDPNALARALRPTPFRPLDNPGFAPLQLDPTLPSDDALVAPGEQRNARIAGSEKVFLAVWEDDRDGVTSLYGARLYPDGSVLDKGGLRIASGPVSSPHVAFDGATFHVAWSTGVEIRTTTVEPELGTVGDAKVLTTGSDVTVVGLAAVFAVLLPEVASRCLTHRVHSLRSLLTLRLPQRRLSRGTTTCLAIFLVSHGH